MVSAEFPNTICRVVSPRRSDRDDPLRSLEADRSNSKRMQRAWFWWQWTDDELKWDDVPLSLTLLDSQPCHTNRTVQLLSKKTNLVCFSCAVPFPRE